MWTLSIAVACASLEDSLADVPLHQASGEVVRVRCCGAHAAVGGLHDGREDKAAVNASRIGDVDDRFVDRRDLVCAVAGDIPGVAGFVDLLLVGCESGETLDDSLQGYISYTYKSSKESHSASDGHPSASVPLPV
jgi:hypothetical protein